MSPGFWDSRLITHDSSLALLVLVEDLLLLRLELLVREDALIAKLAELGEFLEVVVRPSVATTSTGPPPSS